MDNRRMVDELPGHWPLWAGNKAAEFVRLTSGRSGCSLGYATPVAFAAEIEQQRFGRVQAVALGTPVPTTIAGLWSPLDEAVGGVSTVHVRRAP